MNAERFNNLIFNRRSNDVPVVTGSRVSGEPVAFSGAVSQTAETIRQSGASRLLLCSEDTGLFMVGLLAGIRCGVDLVFPPNYRPGSIDRLSGELDAILTDTPIDNAPNVLISEQGTYAAEVPTERLRTTLRFFTSGSEGDPKAIVKTAGQLVAEVTSLEQALGDRAAGTTVYSMVPHHHLYGFTFQVMWPLLSGRTIFSGRLYHWTDLLNNMSKNAFVVSAPTHLDRLQEETDLSSANGIKVVLSAGAPLSQASADRARDKLGTAPIEIFGSTETGAVAWRDHAGGDCPWRVFPSVEVRTNAAGHLQVSSPYTSTDEPTADQVELLADGRFVFKGRADRIAKIEGKRISLTALERQLDAHPFVDAVAVLLLDEAQRTNIAAAVALNQKGWRAFRGLGKFRLERLLRQELWAFEDASMLPRRWRFVDELPGNAMGKLQRNDITALFDADQPASPGTNLDWHPFILSETQIEDGVVLELELSPSLAWFEGHFPDFPILPGIVQLHWAHHYLREKLGLDIPAPTAFQTKYRGVLQPGETCRLTLRHQKEKGRVSFSYDSDKGPHSSGSWKVGG